MKVAMLSDLATAALRPEDTLSTHFCNRLSRPQGHNAAERNVNEKIPMAPLVRETANFRLVAHYLNQPRNLVIPHKIKRPLNPCFVLDGPGMESRWERNFPHPCGLVLGLTQHPIEWMPCLIAGVKQQKCGFNHPPYLAPRLRKG
jgi:hypothetical protein